MERTDLELLRELLKVVIWHEERSPDFIGDLYTDDQWDIVSEAVVRTTRTQGE